MEKGTFVGTSSLIATEICVTCVCVCVCVCMYMYVYKTWDQYLAYYVEIHVDNSKQFPYTYGLHLDNRMEIKFSMQLIAVIYLISTRISPVL